MRYLLALLTIWFCSCAMPSASRAPGNGSTPAPASSSVPEHPEVASAAAMDASPPAPRLDPSSHLQAGRAALQQKNGPLAVAHLRACLEQDPSNTECLWELGWAH